MKRILFPILLLFTTLSLLAENKNKPYSTYIIKKGDNVSEILKNHELSPLYGKDKWVEKVLRLNRLTYKSAKDLDPQDVIILPLASNQQTDSLKTSQAAPVRQSTFSRESKRNYGLTLTGSYFSRSFNFEKNNEEVDLGQNFLVSLEAKKNFDLPNQRYTWTPIVSAGLYTQSQADFKSNRSLSADFSPSYLGSLALKIEDSKTLSAITAGFEYESFSLLEIQQNQYQVNQRELGWKGLKLSQGLQINQQRYSLHIGHFRETTYNSFKSMIELSALFNQLYKLQVYANQMELKISQKTKVDNLGISLGYKF